MKTDITGPPVSESSRSTVMLLHLSALAGLVTGIGFLLGPLVVWLLLGASPPFVIERGEVAACVCLPEFAAPGLRSGELKVLYDGKASSDIYGEEVASGHEGPMINVFLAGKEWAEQYPDEVEFFLDVWQRGLEEWSANQAEIIETYPQHFAVEDPKDVEFVQEYVADHNWFVEDIRFDEGWVEGESEIFGLLKETGFMNEDQETPDFRISGE